MQSSTHTFEKQQVDKKIPHRWNYKKVLKFITIMKSSV